MLVQEIADMSKVSLVDEFGKFRNSVVKTTPNLIHNKGFIKNIWKAFEIISSRLRY